MEKVLSADLASLLDTSGITTGGEFSVTDDEIKLTTNGFAELTLGLSLYDWQARAVLPLESATGPTGKRQNIAIVTPNGSGKDSFIIPAAAYWWLFYNPRGRVVITTKSDLQLETQTK